ncbi:HMA domain-containing protein [Cephalotus follicularis]|uniref:HMA domain-containing protein n=1 Tax=Cephalotus follicularis TaxID=3775 RepID=A0A1Q3B8C6_CEPFO|nr:HMA domain-containing protein [Cephalotus follicularis]
MVPELEKPRVIEIQLRMDCNGCVQKIKKALYGINGIYDFHIDFPQQKLTIIGWADQEKIVKAIKKTRKIASIHTEEPPPAQPAEQKPPEGGAPPPETANPPPAEAPATEAAPAAEPPKDPPQPENPQPQVQPPPTATNSNASNGSQPAQPSGPKDVGEVHVIYHHPPDYGYRYGYASHSYTGHWHRYPSGPGLPQEQPQPSHVTHSYNTYKPSPYVTEYAYIHSPPRHRQFSRTDRYSEDNHNADNQNTYGNGNITSMFSDENPNACTIA